MRNLIVCSDGTWNTPEQKEHDIPIPTNVVRIYNAIEQINSVTGIEQLKYYHPGVGADGDWWEKLAGGTVGVGLSKNIRSAYKWLALNYEPGDEIYLFGFSRGAYTVRSLAGMISSCGLLDLHGLTDDELWMRVKKAYAEGYREKKSVAQWADKWKFHKESTAKKSVPICFLGVWDTVGALGVPNNMAILNLLDSVKKYNFHETTLNKDIKHGRHAVALDEQRASFSPTLWSNVGKHSDAKQVWFPGVHSNVGGGYLNKGLSDGALKWMMDEAIAVGLGFHADMYEQVQPDSKAVLYDSLSGIFKHQRTMPRSIPIIGSKHVKEILHTSVLERQKKPPIEQASYHETLDLKQKGDSFELSIYAMEPWNETGIYLEADVKYKFEASGQWMDRKIKCGPEGADDGEFSVGEIAHLAGSLLGSLEGFYKKITNNESADFLGSRREENIPWFALTGVVANGGNPKEDGTPAPHEIFEIAKGCTCSPDKSGYLYAYANDSWHFYGNNRGSVMLKITRMT